ncbi:DUF4189 domain-containing protein [Spirillospora albida]|uniref:DUF4189 domain-containing protein n=1 Tax=Spirillospora albida TaxID=58123 RepID=UPI0009FC8A53|nr:DUF4189 domain-containing protein [Spirillospora albida]
MVFIVLAVAGAFVLVFGGAFVWLVSGSDDTPRAPVAARTTLDIPTPPSFTPPTLPSTPTTPETTYSPPPQNYGAIAVGRNGAIGKAWDYDSPAAARRRALNECPTSGCKVLTTFVDGCGAVAFNPRTNKYWGGSGKTRSAATSDAISNAGGGRWITWVCTTR